MCYFLILQFFLYLFLYSVHQLSFFCANNPFSLVSCLSQERIYNGFQISIDLDLPSRLRQYLESKSRIRQRINRAKLLSHNFFTSGTYINPCRVYIIPKKRFRDYVQKFQDLFWVRILILNFLWLFTKREIQRVNYKYIAGRR